jgi:hypothetical protein
MITSECDGLKKYLAEKIPENTLIEILNKTNRLGIYFQNKIEYKYLEDNGILNLDFVKVNELIFQDKIDWDSIINKIHNKIT